MCGGVGVHVYQGEHVNVRKQFVEIGSFLPRMKFTSILVASECFRPLSHIADLVSSFKTQQTKSLSWPIVLDTQKVD